MIFYVSEIYSITRQNIQDTKSFVNNDFIEKYFINDKIERLISKQICLNYLFLISPFST